MAAAEPPEVVRSAGPQDTERVGARLVRELHPGAIVLLCGDLGAGKTTLVRGAVRELGHPGRVTSPTFTLVNRYAGGRVPVSHLDLYRLGAAGLDEEDPALLEEELAGDRIVFVEWPEAAVAELGPVAVRVELRHAGGDAREIEIARTGGGRG
ncbi:tRNA (adenosine(37)-N6)-threonylcarbamoyltransferase complex ATPase subunit type 1 TsaE [Capillimicrobium parvum]|uniref:tRNA threonylcarbamoyladenosine biosynthesis protein TsaE n=1 Tax=Capillimicrobium parvum TaxID=2884022 RepID=A0A9E6XZJ2_9ACTN|nr:tRNA (adenosine(37)-N6)-threonylcarbamoyltransferase complex ATPase subunit type 1 TsaE [Capillimicrobium parvum]UGS37412.1 tRNA threonylcarbamoyladenosine biosynthesis protein TsaE [Capillimicrobium parvum]